MISGKIEVNQFSYILLILANFEDGRLGNIVILSFFNVYLTRVEYTLKGWSLACLGTSKY